MISPFRRDCDMIPMSSMTIRFVTLSPTILLFNVQRQCTLMSH
nr:MAG TPA: hypothetical protein [Crassvirales sp.]